MSEPTTPPPLPETPAQPVVLREPAGAQPPPLPTPAPAMPAPAAVIREPVEIPAGEIPADWRGIFEPGEQILWQGRGRSGAAVATRVARGSVVSAAIMIGFSVFWMGVASRGGGIIWLFGLIFLYKGLKNLRAALRGEPTGKLLAKGAYYTLTNRAAYIGRAGNDLERIEILPAMRMTLHQDSVLFATRKGLDGRSDMPYGFENIDNAAEVFAMMRGIEREAR